MADLEAKTKSRDMSGMRAGIAVADEELLASLGYKQEFRREFTGLEVSNVLVYYIKTMGVRWDVPGAIPDPRVRGGPAADLCSIDRRLGLRLASSVCCHPLRMYCPISHHILAAPT